MSDQEPGDVPVSGPAEAAPSTEAPAEWPPPPEVPRRSPVVRRWAVSPVTAAALLAAAVVLHVVAMFPAYLSTGGSVPSLAGQSDQAALYGVVAGMWALALAATLLGPHRARLGAGLAVGIAATELGFRIADFAEALGVPGSSPGAGAWLMTAAWVVGAAGTAAAVLVARRVVHPDGEVGWVRPRGAQVPALLAAAAVSLFCAGTFLPAWDHFHATVAANGATADLSAGNVFTGPWEIMFGNVVVAAVLAGLPIAAVLWRPSLLAGGAVLGACGLFASQLVAAAVQAGQPVSPAVVGISPSRAQALGVRVSLTLTGWYTAEVVALALVAVLGALLLTMPDGWVRSAGWWRSPAAGNGDSGGPWGWPGGNPAVGAGPGPWHPGAGAAAPGSDPRAGQSAPHSTAPAPEVASASWPPPPWSQGPWPAWGGEGGGWPRGQPAPGAVAAPPLPDALPDAPPASPLPDQAPHRAVTDGGTVGRESGAGLAFRLAGESDVAGLVALVESAYRGPASRVGWTTEADLLDGQRTDPDGVRAAVAAPGSLVLVAEEGGDLVGCCQLQQRGDDAYFGMFAVRPTRQGRGWGKAILAEAERTAVARWGARRMQMSVIAQRSDLIAWYRRRGFEPTGESSPFPYGDARYGIPRRPDLAFTSLAKALPPPGARQT